ncbi:MAG: hypothetical protein ACT4O2_01850 [Beijerinckiaceae bacterium]
MSVAWAGEIVKQVGVGTIDRVNAGGGGLVVLIAMCILFGAATYFTGRLYGQIGYITCAVGFLIVVITLGFVGGWSL